MLIGAHSFAKAAVGALVEILDREDESVGVLLHFERAMAAYLLTGRAATAFVFVVGYEVHVFGGLIDSLIQEAEGSSALGIEDAIYVHIVDFGTAFHGSIGEDHSVGEASLSEDTFYTCRESRGLEHKELFV